MKIDISKNFHMATFPSKVASMNDMYKHVYNIVITDELLDNGTLCGRGDYVSFDQYEQAALPAGFEGRINEASRANKGYWYVEVTALPDDEVLYMYNSAVSEYTERELKDERLFVNEEGDVIQGAVLCIGDVIEISTEGFDGTPAAGASVTFENGKYKVGA